MSDAKVIYVEGDDPDMLAAYARARATFGYFWRELTWEYRRIVPALGTAGVKTVFSDAKPGKRSKAKPKAEQMWIGDVTFDGRTVRGRLLNSPNHLTSVAAGDMVSRTLDEITDWLYSISDRAYGGFTIAVLRARMSAAERTEHDRAWGLTFGGPADVRLVPRWDDGATPDDEHPMSRSMGEALERELEKNPAPYLAPADDGWSTLHSMCLGGSADAVRLLLEAGADPNVPAPNGMTPLQLAQTLGWEKVTALLVKHGAR